MVFQNRSKLPFRKNCEGYFTDNQERILAKKNKQGIIIFPGGGIEEGETIEQGMLRETLEETGAVIKDIKFIGNLKIFWSEEWAKTEKQKVRYNKFQGDDMYFFSGKIVRFQRPSSTEGDYWKKISLLKMDEIIKHIKISEKGIGAYREKQIFFLEGIGKPQAY